MIHCFSGNQFSPLFMLQKYFSKSARTPQYTILYWRLPLVMRSRKAGLPLATRARKRELCLKGVQASHFGKKDFKLGVGGVGQNTSRNFEGSF